MTGRARNPSVPIDEEELSQIRRYEDFSTTGIIRLFVNARSISAFLHKKN